MSSDLNEDSFFIVDFDDGPKHSITLQQSISQSPNSKLFSNNISNRFNGENKAIDVLIRDRQNDKMKLNQDFHDYLLATGDSSELSVISFMGDKQKGKSFLIDCLITAESGKISRVMSKNTRKPLIATSTYKYERYPHGQALLLDSSGQIELNTFLWMYYTSSIIVFSVESNSRSEKKHFLSLIDRMQNLIKDNEDHTKPQLVIARRNYEENNEYEKERDFIHVVQQSKLFHPNLIVINFPDPGTTQNRPHELLDIPPSQLSPIFLQKVKTLSKLVKNSETKGLKNNAVNQKILAFTLSSLTTKLNEEKSLEYQKIWEDIVKEYSLGYSNIYLKEYMANYEKSQYRSSNGEAMSEYQTANFLRKLRRQAERKTTGFHNLDGEPIFEESERYVQQKIKQKQDEEINNNHERIHQENTQICLESLSHLNQNNYLKVLDDYHSSAKQQYHKSDILLDNLNLQLGKGLIGESHQQETVLKLAQVEKEGEDLDDQIRQLESSISKHDNESEEAEVLVKDNESKKNQIIYFRERNMNRQSSKSLNPEIAALEKEIQQLQSNINNCDNEKEDIVKRKDSLILRRQKEIEKQLENEEEEFTKFKLSATRLGFKGIKDAETGAKDTCCSLM